MYALDVLYFMYVMYAQSKTEYKKLFKLVDNYH